MKKNQLTERFQSIKGFDLNLLTVFEAVFIYGSVTQAAKHLHLTPSAVSQALNRLRVYFSDPLFIRHGSHLEPSTIAHSIHEELYEAFDILLAKFQGLHTYNKKQIVISCSPFLSTSILGKIFNIITNTDPTCRLIHSINDNSSTSIDDLLTYRKADIVIDIHAHNSTTRESKLLYSDQSVLICSKAHPRIGDFLTIEQASKESFTLFDSDNIHVSGWQKTIDDALGKTRNIGFISPSIFSIVSVIEHSELIGFIPLSLYNMIKNTSATRKIETDLPHPDINIYMIYNKSALHNKFLANIVGQILMEL